jgi:hypothetical protein
VTDRGKQGRVIRRYRRNIPRTDFEAWSKDKRCHARSGGLYALYKGKEGKLLYVGLATRSVESRIRSHIKAGKIRFTHFSVFLIAGKNCDARRRRVRDLEALLHVVLKHRLPNNLNHTKFVHATRLPKPNLVQPSAGF